MTKQFDLNIEKILDNWEVYHAVREIISNALDEQIITHTAEPNFCKDDAGMWHIRDYGRGLRHTHLTQNESAEKKKCKNVIGKFGVGLKDALAVLYKNNIPVFIKTRHGDISLDMLPKEGFPDIKTLHAIISDPSDGDFVGTEFVIGVSDEDIARAKSLFLVFSGRKPLDITPFGEIYTRSGVQGASIYVHGVKIAEEPNYLFDYNITKTNAALDKSLNRERSAVGRTAYSDIVKKVLLKAKSDSVIERLIAQLDLIPKGTCCDEIQLTDIQIHAIKIYNSIKKIVFVSQSQSYTFGNDDKEKIRESGREIVFVPDAIYEKIRKMKDYEGNEIGTFTTVVREYNENFKYEMIAEEDLTDKERDVLSLKHWVMSLYGDRRYLKKIFISNNINQMTSGDTLGVYESLEDKIVIKRSVLQNRYQFCEILFHELVHATTSYSDNTREFENELGSIINTLSRLALEADKKKK